MKIANRVLITGGAGFIGSELSRLWASRDAHVLIVDNLINGKREHVEPFLGPTVSFHEVDIRDEEQMQPLLRGVDIVYNLACLGVRHSIHNPLENHQVNAHATLLLLQLARAAGVTRFVQVSTSEVYGTAKWVPMDENHPTFPMTVYGASKLAGDCYARAFCSTYGFETVVVRPFNAFGPRSHHEGDSGEVIPKFMLRSMAGLPMIVFGEGTQTRDFTYVEDSARGILLTGLSTDVVGETLNLGSGKEVTILDLAAKVAEVTKTELRVEHEVPRPGDVLRLCSDATRARKVLGYSPQYSLSEGLQELFSWYESTGVDPADLLREEVVRNWEPSGQL